MMKFAINDLLRESKPSSSTTTTHEINAKPLTCTSMGVENNGHLENQQQRLSQLFQVITENIRRMNQEQIKSTGLLNSLTEKVRFDRIESTPTTATTTTGKDVESDDVDEGGGLFGEETDGPHQFSRYLLTRKTKRIRTAFSPSQLISLEGAFEKNRYVVGQERRDLAVSLKLTETQVKVWFQNRRTKFKRSQGHETPPSTSQDSPALFLDTDHNQHTNQLHNQQRSYHGQTIDNNNLSRQSAHHFPETAAYKNFGNISQDLPNKLFFNVLYGKR